MESWAQSMLQGGASWPSLSSPTSGPTESHESNSRAVEDPSTAIRDEPGQALSMTLSSASLTDLSGVPPVFEWTSSGLDGLLSRGTSGLDAVLNGTSEDEAEDDSESHFTDLHVEQPMSIDNVEENGEGLNDEHTACQIYTARPLRLNTTAPPRFDPVPGVQRTIQKSSLPYAPAPAPRRRRRRNQQPRGAHVKNRPEMQETAREGQKHWGNMVQDLRKEWQDKKTWEYCESFREQIQMCSRTHIKSQHECLLRQLQMALVDKIITASDFSASEDDSFLGWVGFQIVAEHKDEFRARIEGMFATVPKENTLNNAFRRAGLVPKQCWNEAWKGKAAFFYDGTKRATYTQQH
eukprot:CAMPEP_0177703620 /NCGR_PEP_ID=MMETSP0484_2-20121128/7769_1 /TAXON_ID=354590 /ORGANISM="Rhodomonas lens, Strain RHODO" /LENGTH=349 /DNA_ID=CAMNT_0019214987 /DNA_START=263 /DNA_END=1312 /DNA_ORIENTATION=+